MIQTVLSLFLIAYLPGAVIYRLPFAQRARRAALPADSFDTLVRAVRGAGIPGETTVFPGLSHGETFRASIGFLIENGFSATESR